MRRLAAILLLAGCSYVPESGTVGDPVSEIWTYHADGIDNAEVSVALVKEGIPAFAGDPKTIFRIGTFTDFFVLEAAYRIEERGEIDLNRPLTAFARFPLDPLYGRIAMRDLAELKAPPIDSDWELAFLAERFGWTSDGRLALLAALLENAVGKSVDEIVRDEVVLPLMLRDTSFAPSADKESRLATGDQGFDGLYSSVEDCVKFFASSERIRRSALMRHRRVHDVGIDYVVGQVCGGRRFLAFPEGKRDFLLIFRNVTGWSQFKDFEFASEVFAE